jgi:hypothetical protein
MTSLFPWSIALDSAREVWRLFIFFSPFLRSLRSRISQILIHHTLRKAQTGQDQETSKSSQHKSPQSKSTKHRPSPVQITLVHITSIYSILCPVETLPNKHQHITANGKRDSIFTMAIGGGLLRVTGTFFYALAFCCAAIILGKFILLGI